VLIYSLEVFHAGGASLVILLVQEITAHSFQFDGFISGVQVEPRSAKCDQMASQIVLPPSVSLDISIGMVPNAFFLFLLHQFVLVGPQPTKY
jgi:hypothetical protein